MISGVHDRPVLLTEPDFTSAPSLIGNRLMSIPEVGFGPRPAAWIGRNPKHSLAMRWRGLTRIEAKEIERLAYDVNGRWGELFVPSWMNELLLYGTASPGDTTIEIHECDFDGTFRVDSADPVAFGNTLLIWNKSGAHEIVTVASVASASPKETITLNESLLNEYKVGSTAICFLYLVRLATDRIEVKWQSEDHASIDMAFVEVRVADENPDTPASDASGSDGGTVAAVAAGGDHNDCGAELPDLGGNEIAYDDFECYEHLASSEELCGATTPLEGLPNEHQGWAGAWTIEASYTGTIACDSFEGETVEDPLVATLDGGDGWDSSWTVEGSYAGIQASEDFESYDAEDPLTATLSGGTGWDGDWTVT